MGNTTTRLVDVEASKWSTPYNAPRQIDTHVMKTIDNDAISNLPVVKNFRKVIKTHDLSLMHKELYDFLIQYCGFIAHYNIHGFRETYEDPREFEGIFIRHFDRNHCYFNGGYECHNSPYKDTGYTKNEIKEKFFRIVDSYKDDIANWADDIAKERRYAALQVLKKEFDQEENLSEPCRENVDVKIKKNREETDQGKQGSLF